RRAHRARYAAEGKRLDGNPAGAVAHGGLHNGRRCDRSLVLSRNLRLNTLPYEANCLPSRDRVGAMHCALLPQFSFREACQPLSLAILKIAAAKKPVANDAHSSGHMGHCHRPRWSIAREIGSPAPARFAEHLPKQLHRAHSVAAVVVPDPMLLGLGVATEV